MAQFWKFGNAIINLDKIIEVDQRQDYFLARVSDGLWIQCAGEFPDELVHGKQLPVIEDHRA